MEFEYIETPHGIFTNNPEKGQTAEENYQDYLNSLNNQSDPLTSEERINQLESALLEATMLLAEEQQKNQQNEQAILELSILIAGGVV